MPPRPSRALPSLFGTSALALALLAPSAQAETGTLRSLDGSFVLTGEITFAADGSYLIEGPLGALRIAADRVTCEGAACLAPEISAAPVAVGAPVAEAFVAPQPVPEAEPEPEAETVAAASQAAPDLTTELAGALASLMDGDVVAGLSGPRLTLPAGDVVLSGGAGGLAALVSGNVSLVLAAGDLPEGEAGAGLRIAVVAQDALAAVTHPANPVRQLTLAQLRDIYAGRIANWKALDGPDRPIRVIGLSPDDPRSAALEAALFKGEEVTRAEGLEAAEGIAGLGQVTDDPDAIAFVPQAALGGAQPVEIVDSCGLTTSPDLRSLKSGAYPLMVPVALIGRADTVDAAATGLIDLALSTAADRAIRSAGLVDRAILQAPITGLDPARMGTGRTARTLLTDAAGHERLTSVFRFAFGSAALAAEADADLARLVDHLSALPEGSRILVAGFSDDVGSSQTNRQVSVARAQAVAAAIKGVGGERLAGLEITAKGYGELLPIGCNDTEPGRALNRRVEIWIEAGNLAQNPSN